MTSVDKPLLVPAPFQGSASHLTEHRRKVRPAKSGEADLRSRDDIHAAGIHGCTNAVQYEVGHEIRLIEHVHVGPCGEVSPTTLEAQLRIDLVLQTSAAAILNEGPGRGVREIVNVRLVSHLLLADGLLAEESRRNE